MLKVKDGAALDQPAVIGLNYALDNLQELLVNPSIQANKLLHATLSQMNDTLIESLGGTLAKPATPPSLYSSENPLNTDNGTQAYHTIHRIRDSHYDDDPSHGPTPEESRSGRGRNGAGSMNWRDDNLIDDVQKLVESKESVLPILTRMPA